LKEGIDLDLLQLILDAKGKKASDLHITVGVPPIIRINGILKQMEDYPILNTEDIKNLCLPAINDAQKAALEKNGEIEFVYIIYRTGRFRASYFKQRGSIAATFRMYINESPTIDEMELPSIFKNIALEQNGLVLITGPTGSGKSTTLASIINHINTNRESHIITIEDPIEYLHKHNRSIVNQREVGQDTVSFSGALRSALREDPDVIMLGEMRDLETISTAITASETGHLVLSTLHTIDAAQTIERIIDIFPPQQQAQIRIQLINSVKAIISQRLVKRANSTGRIAVFEILIMNDVIRNLIRDSKTHHIASVIQENTKNGMFTMDHCLAEYVKQGKVSLEEAHNNCNNKELFDSLLNAKF
jgi:twitching motility protein PilT